MSKIARLIKDKIYILTFLSIISIPSIQLFTNVIDIDSDMEKRTKASRPSIADAENLGEYFSNYETYFNDNFGFRSDLIALNSKIDVNIFKQSSNDQVVLGKNNFLYYKDEMADYHKTNILSSEEIDTIAFKIKSFQDNLKKIRNIEFIFSLAPNKSTIYPEYVIENSENPTSKSNLDLLQERLDYYGVNYINLKEKLISEKENYQLYHARDTHWNDIASVIVGNEYLKYFNSKFGTNHSLEMINPRIGTYNGDLDNLLGYYTNTPEWICDYKLNMNGEKLPKSLSYADSFGNTVMPLINSAFNQSMNMHTKLAPVASNFPLFSDNAKVVIFEIVERDIYALLDYDFSIFNEYTEEIDKTHTREIVNLNLNPNLQLFDTAYIPLEESFVFSSNTPDSSFIIDQDFNLDYLHLNMHEVKEYNIITFYWATDDENFTEEKSFPFLLIPDKNEYVLNLKDQNMVGNKLKIKISDRENVDLNIKEINFYNKLQ